MHEGPQRVARSGNEPLLAGMIVSNEPGYYEAGAFGIRIENLLLVREDPDFPEMLSFETLTFAPIDRRLIDTALLTAAERDWLNAYHARGTRDRRLRGPCVAGSRHGPDMTPPGAAGA